MTPRDTTTTDGTLGPAEKPVNRRADPRYMPRAKVKVECRRGQSGLGPNLATGLLDLSQLGAKLTTKDELAAGTAVEISLLSAGLTKPIKVPAEVVRSEALKNDTWRLGVRFTKALTYAELRQLTNF
jgi:hypothetical protein